MALIDEYMPGKWRVRWFEKKVRKSKVFKDYVESCNFRDEAEKLEKQSFIPAWEPPPSQKTPPVAQEGATKTFEDLCAYYINVRAVGKKSLSDDKSIINAHLKPYFGDKFLKDISTEVVDNFIAAKKSEISKVTGKVIEKQTLKNVLTLLGALLRVAKERLRWIDEMPLIEKPKIRFGSAGFSYLKTQDEIDRFLESTKREEFVVQALYFTAIASGLRQGELAALSWDDVSFEDRFILVNKSFDTDTKASDLRHVPISDELLPVLEWWKDVSKEDREKAGHNMLFFSVRDKKPLIQSNVIWDEVFKRCLVRAGFPEDYITFHDTRHCFASHYLKRGGRLALLQRYLGHKSPILTQIYSHLEKADFLADPTLFAETIKKKDLDGPIKFVPGIATTDGKKIKPGKIEPFREGLWRVRWTINSKTKSKYFKSIEEAQSFIEGFETYLVNQQEAS